MVTHTMKDAKHERTRNDICVGVISCLMCVLGHTTHAEHEMTPTRVLFCAQRVWEFMEEVDEEDFLLITLTVNEINKN